MGVESEFHHEGGQLARIHCKKTAQHLLQLGVVLHVEPVDHRWRQFGQIGDQPDFAFGIGAGGFLRGEMVAHRGAA